MRNFNSQAHIQLEKMVHRHLLNYCLGRDKAVKAWVLAEAFSTSVRDINDVVRSLRRSGVLIGSSKQKPYGYFVPVTDDEVRDYMRSFRSELFDMLETFNRQKRAVKAVAMSLNYQDLFPGM